MEIDDVYRLTGEFGCFQWQIFIGSLIISLFCGTEMVQNMFSGAIPVNMNCSDSNLDACDDNCSLIMYPDDKFISFPTEWNMTCGADRVKTQSTQSIYMLGIMIGSTIVGGAGDKFGRLPVVLACQFLSGLFSLVSAFAQTWKVYACLRFFTGFFLSGVIIVSFVLTSELVAPSKRAVFGTMPSLAFAAGIAILSLVSWVTHNWRVMTAIFGAFGLLSTLPLYWLFEESPRWYLSKGNVKKSKTILRKIAKINGHDLGDIELRICSMAESNDGVKTSLLSIFTNGILRKITLVQIISWFTCSSVYYGLTLASSDMGGNRYVSVILSGLVEIPSIVFIYFVMNIPQCGRVRSLAFGLVASSIFCGSIWFLSEEHSAVITGLACAGKFCIVTSFAIIYVQAAEMYPTPIRNVGLGVVSVASRIGGIMAPLILNLNHIYHNSHFMVFGVLGCVAGVLCLVLPETLGRPLPESPEDLYSSTKILVKDTIAMASGDRQPLVSDMIEEDDELGAKF